METDNRSEAQKREDAASDAYDAALDGIENALRRMRAVFPSQVGQQADRVRKQLYMLEMWAKAVEFAVDMAETVDNDD